MPLASVLLADDNSEILDHVSKLLRKHGEYEVVAALNNGATVVRECARYRPDVVVLDISMGAVNGIDVAEELRASGSLSKIIFLTVHEDSDFVHAAMGAGGSAYVVKSRLSIDLSSAIEAVLSGKLFISPSLLR